MPLQRVGREDCPAGGLELSKAARLQSQAVHVNGVLAAFRIKAWTLVMGWNISLGTIGVERMLRNLQRMARNRGRSRADLETCNILMILL